MSINEPYKLNKKGRHPNMDAVLLLLFNPKPYAFFLSKSNTIGDAIKIEE